VTFTKEAGRWYKSLGSEDTIRIRASIEELRLRGPALGRPYVDSIKASRHPNMKELRSVGGNLRALFAFDRRRRAIVLVGGDKTNNWAGWYRQNIPLADRLLDLHHRREGGGWRVTGREPDGPSR
jgi:hypothetical protein